MNNRHLLIALTALMLTAPLQTTWADDDHPPAPCRPNKDSTPSSQGADGWATVGGPIWGGCGVTNSRIYHIHNRKQLVDSLIRDKKKKTLDNRLDHRAKIIYVHGTIDLNVD